MYIVIDSDINKVVFQLNDTISVSSSLYYYAIDSGFCQGDETIKKCFKNIESIVENWINIITNSFVGEKLFAPFVYEDEYIGIFQFALINDNTIKISFFYTNKLAGYSLIPSESSIISMNFIIPSFEFELIVQKSEFLKITVELGRVSD